MIKIGYFEDFKQDNSVLFSVDIDGAKILENAFKQLSNAECYQMEFDRLETIDPIYKIQILGQISETDLGMVRVAENKFLWRNTKKTWKLHAAQITGFYKEQNSDNTPGHHYLDIDNSDIHDDLQVVVSYLEYPENFWSKFKAPDI